MGYDTRRKLLTGIEKGTTFLKQKDLTLNYSNA